MYANTDAECTGKAWRSGLATQGDQQDNIETTMLGNIGWKLETESKGNQWLRDVVCTIKYENVNSPRERRLRKMSEEIS